MTTLLAAWPLSLAHPGGHRAVQPWRGTCLLQAGPPAVLSRPPRLLPSPNSGRPQGEDAVPGPWDFCSLEEDKRPCRAQKHVLLSLGGPLQGLPQGVPRLVDGPSPEVAAGSPEYSCHLVGHGPGQQAEWPRPGSPAPLLCWCRGRADVPSLLPGSVSRSPRRLRIARGLRGTLGGPHEGSGTGLWGPC